MMGWWSLPTLRAWVHERNQKKEPEVGQPGEKGITETQVEWSTVWNATERYSK